MPLAPDDHLPATPPLSAEQRKARADEWLEVIRLRVLISQELDHHGVKSAAQIGEVLGLNAMEAHSLLSARRWHEGDLARLQAAAERLGISAPEEGPQW
jgi:hypothetical protein